MAIKVLYFLVLVCVHLTGANGSENDQPQPIHASCTNDFRGLPSCHFDMSFCGSYRDISMDSGGLSWKRGSKVVLESGNGILKDWQPRIKQGRQGKFVYLDVTNTSVPVGSKSRLGGQLLFSRSIKAVCMEFHYATVGDGNDIPAFSVYNRFDNGGGLLIGKIEENTQGKWKVARFHSCVGNRRSLISFEGEKTSENSIVALDYIKITRSTMNCSGFDENQYTLPPFTTPVTKPDSNTVRLGRSSSTLNTKTTNLPRPTVAMTTVSAIPFTPKTVGARIIITPNNSIETIDTYVQIHCDLGFHSNKDNNNNSSNKYKEVYVVEIVKDGKQQMAIIKPGSRIFFKHADVEKRAQASGNLDNDVSATYLTLTLLQPKAEDTGVYSCVVFYEDQAGLLQQEKVFARLEVNRFNFDNNPLLEKVLKSFSRRIQDMDEEIKQLQDKLKNC